MKPLLPFLLALFFSPAYSQFDIPDSVFYNASLATDLLLDGKFKLSTIYIFYSDKNNIHEKHSNNFNKIIPKNNKSCPIGAILKLQNFNPLTDSIEYIFGLGGGEYKNMQGFDAAVINVSYHNPPPVSSSPSIATTPIKLNIRNNEIYTAEYNHVPNINGKSFLKVAGSQQQRATISVKGNSERQQVLIGIFGPDKDLIGVLNPMIDDSFITNQKVYVIPFIRPRVAGLNQLIFEIGDPRVNGTVNVTEKPFRKG